MNRERPPSDRCAGGLLLEASASMAIATLLLVCFHTAMVSVKRLEATAEAQNRGLVVLANVVERLEAMDAPTPDDAASVLKHEFDLSGFGGGAYYRPECERVGSGVELSILDPDDKALVAVRVGR